MSDYRITIFDLCGTVTKTNNTYEFISFVLKLRSPVKYIAFKSAMKMAAVFRFLGFEKMAHRDLCRSLAVGFLRGYPVEIISDIAVQYARHLKDNSLYHKDIVGILKRAQSSGSRVILLSACIDPPVSQIADSLGVKEIYASSLEVKDGCYTGRIAEDTLGRKGAVMDSIPGFARAGAVFYTDNSEDAALNGKVEKLVMLDRKGVFRDPGAFRDEGSINSRNVLLSYIPTFYYTLSRFHRDGVAKLVLKEIVPVFLIVWSSGNIDAFGSALMVLMSFAVFYSVYEIGGLYNDLHAVKEKSRNTMFRIAEGVKVRMGVFIAVRALFFTAFLIFLRASGHQFFPYAVLMAVCLSVYLVHTLVGGRLRMLTYACLSALRIAIPLVLFYGMIPFFNIFAAFLIVIFPKKFYVYVARRRGDYNMFNNAASNIFYYSAVILFGTVMYFLTGFKFYFFLPGYMFMVDSAIYFVRRYRRMAEVF